MMRIRRGGLCGFVVLLSILNLSAVESDLRLFDAIQGKDKNAVRALLSENIDINAPQPNGTTALLLAAQLDDLELADLLIRAGANLNASNEYGVTPLWVACANSSTLMAEKLLNAGANPNSSIGTGETALMQAAHTGNLATVKLLLLHGANVNETSPQRGQTALMRAVAGRHPEVARMLIERGADVRAYSDGGFTPLLFAAQQGDIESAKILLSTGAAVDQPMRDSKSKPPKDIYAPAPGRPDLRPSAAASLQDPSKPSTADFRPTAATNASLNLEGVSEVSTTALLMASASGHESLAIFLLEKGANPNAVDFKGFTALHYALQKGVNSINGTQAANPLEAAYMFRPNMVELIKALLIRGANPNIPIMKFKVGNADRMNLLGATPFLLAAASGDAAVMRLLAASGADPVQPTKDGTTPLMVAAGMARRNDRTQAEEKSALEAVKLALELGNDVNSVTNDGMTALHGAALTGANSIIEHLVAKGANINAKGNIGQVPLSVASGVYPIDLPDNEIRFSLNAVHKDTAELLLKLGASPLDPQKFSSPGKE